MRFVEQSVPGVYVLEPELRSDDRGFFARVYCTREFEAHGLPAMTAQSNISFNHRRGTVRGMHYQVPPAAEAKLVRCTRGAIFDVAVDFRPDSPTYLQHVGAELSEDNRHALFVPEGFAHGYLTLTDGAEVTYQVSEFYAPGLEGGLRHDDPKLAIAWPTEIVVVSDKDASWPLIGEAGGPRGPS